jgi:hypothetical protein
MWLARLDRWRGFIRRQLSRPTKPQIKIVFLHIPKTAGSSLTQVLSRRRNAVQFKDGDTADLNAYMMTDLADVDLITGHLQLPHLLMRDLSGYRFITVLRDPIEREISAYRFIVSWPDHPLHEKFKDCTFEQFFEMTAEARNLQCRYFSGTPNAVEAINAMRLTFDLVGTVEAMPAFLGSLSGMIGEEIKLPWVNKTAPGMSVDLSEDYRRYLRQELAEDYGLYDYVSPVQVGPLFLPSRLPPQEH